MAAKEDLPRRRTTIHDISDDLLDLILLRIPSVAGLVRAAATCKLWRRVIGAGDDFLRRFRRLQGPQILGHYYNFDGWAPSFVPLAAPQGNPAATVSIGDRVSFRFLPDSYYLRRTRLTDSRGGLLAFVRQNWTVLVCCPCTREHKELCRIIWCGYHTHCLAAFLLDGGDEAAGKGLTMSNFRVLYVNLMRHLDDGRKTVEAWVFSATDNQWLQLSTRAIDDMIPDADVFPPPFVFVGRAGGGPLCWSTKGSNAVLHLDESTGEFSDLTLPGNNATVDRNIWYYSRRNLRVIGGDDGTMRLARIVGDDLEVLRYSRLSRGACVVERRVHVSTSSQMDNRGRWYFADTAPEAAAPWHVVLRYTNQCVGDAEYVWMFSVHIQNWKLQRVQKLNIHACGERAFPYELPWTINACL